jgi:hypothetical protein
MADFFGKISIFGMNTRIKPEQEYPSQLLCEPSSSNNSGTRSKSNSFSGNRVSPEPLPEEDAKPYVRSTEGFGRDADNVVEASDKYYIENTETLPCTPMPEYDNGMNTPNSVGVVNKSIEDEYEWLEIDNTTEHNYTFHIRTMYKQVLDDLYRRFVPSITHAKYLEEIRSPSWETFEKKHKI